jgi:hypothetical protein
VFGSMGAGLGPDALDRGSQDAGSALAPQPVRLRDWPSTRSRARRSDS